MDKHFLDFEFKRYTKIIKPYIDELVEKEAVDACHAWLDKLAATADRALRNKYVFKLLYQLARGSLQEPFSKHPPTDALEALPDGADNSYYANLGCLALEHNTSPLAAGDKPSATPENSCETFTVSKENCSYSNLKLKANPLLNMKTNNSTIENRVKNLVTKLRHIKKENAVLHQLLSIKEDYKNNCGDYFSGDYKETTTNVCPKFNHLNSDIQAHFTHPNNIFPCDHSHLNEANNIRMEPVVSKQNIDLIKIKNENEIDETDIIKNYENKLFELTKQHTSSFDDLRQYYESLFNRLKIAHEVKIIQKEDLIKAKDEEIARLNVRINELEDGTPHRNCGLHKIEQRLNKIETSTSKCIKNYQRKILKQRQKYIHDCTMLLELLKQKSVVTKDNEKGRIDLNPFKKLEEKYKNIVAKVQATALQRMIQDQLTMEALVKKISRMSVVCFNTPQKNNADNKTKSREIEDPGPHAPNMVNNPDQSIEPANNEPLPSNNARL